MSNKNKYEAIIGLEVHAQLITQTKAYSSDRTYMVKLQTV